MRRSAAQLVGVKILTMRRLKQLNSSTEIWFKKFFGEIVAKVIKVV